MADMMDIDHQPDQVEEAPAQPDEVEQAAAQSDDDMSDQGIPPGQYSDSDHVDSDTLSLPGREGQEGETEVASGAWEYTFWHEGLKNKLNCIDKGARSTLWHKTWDPNWIKLDRRQNLFCNVTGWGNSSHQYAFKSSHDILVPGKCCTTEYLWYTSTSGKVTDLLFRRIPGPIFVTWSFTSCEERKLTAIEFYYAMSGNKIACIVRKMGTKMTIKKFMEELTIHMTFSNQASRFQVYKPWDPDQYKPNNIITIKWEAISM